MGWKSKYRQLLHAACLGTHLHLIWVVLQQITKIIPYLLRENESILLWSTFPEGLQNLFRYSLGYLWYSIVYLLKPSIFSFLENMMYWGVVHIRDHCKGELFNQFCSSCSITYTNDKVHFKFSLHLNLTQLVICS